MHCFHVTLKIFPFADDFGADYAQDHRENYFEKFMERFELFLDDMRSHKQAYYIRTLEQQLNNPEDHPIDIGLNKGVLEFYSFDFYPRRNNLLTMALDHNATRKFLLTITYL